MLKVIEETGIKNFWQMSERRPLPQETINYVPAVLAAISIGKQGPGRRPVKGVARKKYTPSAPGVGEDGAIWR
ncbi:MAG: hypothetical protein J2P31_04465 [Blastocatellia bacterium]|nr:hypothetical protein [Blastocatellia bacterium]